MYRIFFIEKFMCIYISCRHTFTHSFKHLSENKYYNIVTLDARATTAFGWSQFSSSVISNNYQPIWSAKIKEKSSSYRPTLATAVCALRCSELNSTATAAAQHNCIPRAVARKSRTTRTRALARSQLHNRHSSSLCCWCTLHSAKYMGITHFILHHVPLDACQTMHTNTCTHHNTHIHNPFGHLMESAATRRERTSLMAVIKCNDCVVLPRAHHHIHKYTL